MKLYWDICAFSSLARYKTKKAVKDFFTNEDGDTNIVAMVVLIAVAIILALAFKDAIVNLLKKLFGSINDRADQINDDVTFS